MENKNTKKAIMAIVLFASIIILINLVSAESWACFSKGEKINFCNPQTKDRTCGNNICTFCISNFNAADNCYNQGNFNICNSIPQECSNIGGNTIDREPPVINLVNPVQDAIYTDNSFLIKIILDEKADLLLLDNLNSRSRWTKLCQDCTGFNRNKGFREGFNDITFQAIDVVDNNATKNVKFFIDSKVPKITKTSPKRGFTSGDFNLEFMENNPKLLVLHYGNNATGFRSSNTDISKCFSNRGKYSCNTSIDITSFNNQDMSYWFELKDIADNSALSKPILLKVDTTLPIITSFNSMIHMNHLILDMNITEQNFASVEYIDHLSSRPSWKVLCTHLSKGSCSNRISLSSGSHDIDIKVSDLAENFILKNLKVSI